MSKKDTENYQRLIMNIGENKPHLTFEDVQDIAELIINLDALSYYKDAYIKNVFSESFKKIINADYTNINDRDFTEEVIKIIEGAKERINDYMEGENKWINYE